jgi:predicted nucleotidyltransferase component of viral defense system
MAAVGTRELDPRGDEVIGKPEVMEFSREFGLAPNVVEKDYVLGWLLAGIAHHPHLSSIFVFKGGTCLKDTAF